MAVLHPAPVSTKRFMWDADRREFIAEASDLGRDFRFERVWNDACDVGLTLVSHETGREVVFVLETEKRDREGELLYWQLRPTATDERHFGRMLVTIFND